ncbi:AAA family ATPase [Sinorhizobium sp. RAC02]|uniref:ATP-binding protein n=1 Tax=Sinorhizobium sp. RAC02 TaxID=1842534 RepID=UPI00083CCD4F|nr:AAA family ATPase [Sinorhizobium sp. RAC02]AOF91904.1 AAA domain protein [Sinorhizobium sp. RAC02]
MRLDRLDLVRYGKFTDRSLDFGPVRLGKPDFHLVHGPNEAGKSTLFSAYLDLLFGIEKSSAYGFLHPYSLMRVGGRLSIGGERHDAYRLKRNQASLVSVDDRPLPDTLFASVLGGMDRNAYRTMFSLDDESIEKGGEDILKSEGELGSMLFSASSGLSDMATGLAALKLEADEFYRPSGRKHGLSTLKAEIEALAAERKVLDVAARDYGILVRERDAAAHRHEEVTAARSGMRTALAQVERSLSALPYLRRLRALRAELGAFDLGDSPPATWRSLTGELAREEAEIAARAARVEAERERHVGERAALSEDDAVLAAEADIAALTGSALEARFRTAAMDLSSREAERDRVVATIGAGIVALGLSPDADPAETLLPPGLGEKLAALLSRRTALAERSEAARREHAEAEKVLATTGSKAGSALDEDADKEEALLSTLGAVLRAARSGDLLARMREARRLVALARQEADGAMARLAPWSGTAATLEGLSVPAAAELETLRKRYDAAAEALHRQKEQAAALELDATSSKTMLTALQQETGVVGQDAAGQLRSERELKWQSHLAQLDRGTAEIFEESMRRDDHARDVLLRNADRLSEMRILERSLVEGIARVHALGADVARLEQVRAEIDAEVSSLASSMGLPEETSLAEMSGWLERRSMTLEKLGGVAQQKIEADLVETEAGTLFARLHALLDSKPDGDATLDETLFVAEDRLEALKAARTQRLAAAEHLARAQADVDMRRKAAEEAASALATWQEAWNDAIAGSWLATEKAPAEPERLPSLLPTLQTLAQNVERRRDFDHRIAGMRRDQQEYGSHARRLAERLSEPFQADDPLSTVAGLALRLAAAKIVRERREAIDKTLVRLEEEERGLDERRAVLTSRLAEIFTFLGCDSLADADLLLEAYRKRDDVRGRIEDAARDLVQQMRTETVEEAEALLSAVDDDQLAAERADLSTQLEGLDRAVEEQHLARARAQEALSRVAGSDEAAVLEERRRTALIELAEKSRRYLATRAGILAAEQALRLYRERHRSAMMERASKTFRDITGGEYAGLSTMLEKDGEYLVVNAASGGSKLAKDLSKGTRFQLYLALRVAGYHEIAASREIAPFIADDIMETFDDRRALNALRVMGEMAKGGQVIYLTHHQHLRDLALEACPDVTLHEL